MIKENFKYLINYIYNYIKLIEIIMYIGISLGCVINT
ncbi:hypothetical protein CNEO4_150054 [Clostridium neonatale]|uniref:Uncharacterized protein n=1 Tax=Clostridium neonatale TaxID=137838 RepID=A0AAD1YH30_9CLOT|nr:hypothetical protein CNEO4_150054 [Clostridium neonatale]CAI3606326.1 hypothetical protein CNEO2_340057 [Clostridium neonatale]